MGEALVRAGAKVELHKNHFRDDAPDVEWLREVGRRGWVVLTKDDAIRRSPLELKALIAGNVRAFILTSANMTGEEMANVLVGHLGRIERLARSRRAPFVALVTRSTVKVVGTG